MSLEEQPGPGSVGHNYCDYPELDHAPSFAWSGHQEAGHRIHHFSGDGESIPGIRFSGEGDDISFSDDQNSMTR
jgi:hypothetical protein